MKESIALYRFESEDIKIGIVTRFEGEKPITDGYDICAIFLHIFLYLCTMKCASFPVFFLPKPCEHA